MDITPSSPEGADARRTFFRLVLGQETGYVCLASLSREKPNKMREEYFHWPDQAEEFLSAVEERIPGRDVYFCPQLLGARKRAKANVVLCPVIWADLDECDPDLMHVKPSVAVESSPGRYQAYWVMETPSEPDIAEKLSRRIAYAHAAEGADRSGWDLSQLLRVPMSFNYKYAAPNPATVRTISANRNVYRVEDFDMYPEVTGFEYEDIPFPGNENLPQEDADAILLRFKYRINPLAQRLFLEAPDTDGPDGKSWSEVLWRLELMLFESSMKREEVFIVARASACNKYARDGKPDEWLWREVCRAWARHEENMGMLVPKEPTDMELLSDQEKTDIENTPGFVERYVAWARGLGDAAVQYHHATAFATLSGLLSGPVRLPTSFGIMLPNLWFMILADTTLTRKTTAMDLGMDLIAEIDQDVVLATDGSIEGLLTGLSTRPGRPSIFLRDEFSGLLDAMVKKDYMAGMAETLTKMYDGKMQRRLLRKETIEVREPVLVIFAGGIKHKVCSILTYEQITSGFIPRFIFVTAESDITRLKPMGPPTQTGLGNRQAILDELRDMVAHYSSEQQLVISANSKTATYTQSRRWDAVLTPDAWARYNKIEADLLQSGLVSTMPDLNTPVFDRMSKSTLKAAVLIAAARQRDEQLVVNEQDVVHAAYYAERWRHYAREVIRNVGKTGNERTLDAIMRTVRKGGSNGVSRSTIMQNHWLSSRDAEGIFNTLADRGLITRSKVGRAEMIFSIGSPS